MKAKAHLGSVQGTIANESRVDQDKAERFHDFVMSIRTSNHAPKLWFQQSKCGAIANLRIFRGPVSLCREVSTTMNYKLNQSPEKRKSRLCLMLRLPHLSYAVLVITIPAVNGFNGNQASPNLGASVSEHLVVFNLFLPSHRTIHFSPQGHILTAALASTSFKDMPSLIT